MKRKRPQRPSKITLGMPREPLFVGSYHRIAVKIAKHPTITFDDLRFEVPDGPKAGLVSPSRDRLFDANRPHFLLCVGYEPGTYKLRVVHETSGTLLTGPHSR